MLTLYHTWHTRPFSRPLKIIMAAFIKSISQDIAPRTTCMQRYTRVSNGGEGGSAPLSRDGCRGGFHIIYGLTNLIISNILPHSRPLVSYPDPNLRKHYRLQLVHIGGSGIFVPRINLWCYVTLQCTGAKSVLLTFLKVIRGGY